MCIVARSIARGGRDLESAIPIAIGQIEDWAAGRDGASAKTQAKAAKAVAQWKRMRAAAKADNDVSASTVDEVESPMVALTSGERLLLRWELSTR